jgi:hypothetical protein
MMTFLRAFLRCEAHVGVTLIDGRVLVAVWRLQRSNNEHPELALGASVTYF